MSPIAGLLHGEEPDITFSIFFPIATCNLREYLRAESLHPSANPYPLGGFDVGEKARIIFQAISLVDALDHLHRGLNVEDKSSFSCWHLDLKTQNVLVTFSEIEGKPPVLFQISDFGISRVKRIARPSKVELQRSYNANNLFRRRPSTSLTEGRAGDASECLAPEAYGDGSKVRETSDIWSLGCILSIVFTFLEGGPNTVRSFEDYRKRAPDYNGSWFFKRIPQQQATATVQQATTPVYHDVDRGWLFMRKNTVDSWFNNLMYQAHKRNGEAHSLRLFLDILLSHMLNVDPTRRAGAHAIYKSLNDVRQEFGNAQVEDTQLSRHQPRYPPHGLQPTIETGTPLHDATPHCDPHHFAGSAQQIETMEWQFHRRDRPYIASTPRGMRLTSDLVPRHQAEPVEDIGFSCASLCDAARVGNVPIVGMRLESLPPGTVVKNQDGRTPLSLATENGATAVIEVLLRAGRLQTDGCDDSGRCALSWAAENGHLEAVDMLVRVGKADVDQKSDRYHGWTPLFCAAVNGYARVVKYLLQSAVVEIDGVDAYERTPLSWACDEGFANVVRVLLNTNLVGTERKD